MEYQSENCEEDINQQISIWETKQIKSDKNKDT